MILPARLARRFVHRLWTRLTMRLKQARRKHIRFLSGNGRFGFCTRWPRRAPHTTSPGLRTLDRRLWLVSSSRHFKRLWTATHVCEPLSTVSPESLFREWSKEWKFALNILTLAAGAIPI